MFIELEPVFNNIGEKKEFNYEFVLADSGIKEPAKVSGLVENRAGVVTLTADVRLDYVASCDRCLRDVPQSLNRQFTHVLTRSLQNEENDELILVEDMHFDLDELLREDILLSLPTKVLCKSDCKGLCPMCGADLNNGPCGCKKPVDPRLLTEVSCAVARAAMESGVARKHIEDWEAYKLQLRERMGYESKLTRQLYDIARSNPQRVVFAEGIHPNMLKAAVQAKAEGICQPILLGNDEAITKLAKELDLSLEGIEIVNLRHPDEAPRRERYARILAEKRAREGATYEEANDKMFERNYFGMMMVETGEADAFITGLYTKYSNTIKVAKEVIGIRPEYKHFGTMHILNSKKGTFFLADTLINRHPDTDTLIDIAKLAAHTVRFFNHTPVMAMLSYSNFGADTEGSPVKVHEAVGYMQEKYPDLAIDGEMQVNFAMNREMRDKKYPFTRLLGKDVNTLVFPNLSSANSGYKLLQAMNTDAELIGPIQMGLNKPIHFTDFESSVRDIVNITAVAVIDAIVDKKKAEQ